ncbi:MAG TPA: hypothetical protein VER76_13310 [Pyrinomonadaceae bacterium]|nr:hypothetical protein [Pyrinomonadaceae bacterium]
MNKIYAPFNRLPILFAVVLFAASVCAAQTTASNAHGTTEKAAPAAAANQEKSPTASTLDEELSKTPAGKTVAKFFAALQSGDIKKMRAFHESFGGNPENAEKDMDFYEQTGGLKLHSLTHPAKEQISVLAQTKKDARWVNIMFTLSTEEPYGIRRLSIRPASDPAQTSN